MNTPTWRAIVDALDLVPHPEEGGDFHETYRSRERFEPGGPFAGPRSVGTAIYYLLTPDSYSALRRLSGDEIFHFYLGDPVEMLLLRAPCWSPTREQRERIRALLPVGSQCGR